MAEKSERAWSGNRAPQTENTVTDHAVALSDSSTPLEAPPEVCQLIAEIRQKERAWFSENPGQTLQRPFYAGETWPVTPTPPGPGFNLMMHVSEVARGVRCRLLVAVEDTDSPAHRWLQ